MKNKIPKIKWMDNHYSFQPDISYAKIKGWPVWLPIAIALIGAVSVGYAVAQYSRGGIAPRRYQPAHTQTFSEQMRLENRTYNQPCRQTSKGHYSCNTKKELSYYEEKYGIPKTVTAYNSVLEQTDSTPCILAFT